MMKLKIARLLIENFKGVTRREIDLDGGNAVISGENGTGKTTVADAYIWALTGKMSDGKTAEIGSFDSAGKLDNDATHAVEVAFTDGTTFRRETNGTAKFFANGIPMKRYEFDEAISAATNGAAGLLAMPQMICGMHWQERRQILMQLAKITDAEVIASNAELEPLTEPLKNYTSEQILKQAKAQRKKLSDELTAIPARIDELQRQNVPSRSKAEVQAEIEALRDEFAEKDAAVQEWQERTRKAATPTDEINSLKKAICDLEIATKKTAQQIEQGEQRLQNLRDEYTATAAAMNGECPTCGAKVPAENLPQLQDRLEELIKQGKRLAESLQIKRQAIPAAETELEKLRAELAEKQAAFDNDKSFEESRVKLFEAIHAKDSVRAKLQELTFELKAIEDGEKTAARVKELRQAEINASAKIAEYDRRIYLVELFNKAKITLTEDAINSQFEFVRWKMFADYKTSDGVKECCEPMINGVPYGGNLSKGEKLKATLDILRAIQRLYDVELPVFIDDAESYTSNSQIELPNQIIRLKAVEGAKSLKIDVEKPAAEMSLFEGSWSA